MSQISSAFGNLPGQGPVIETYEAGVLWGPASQYVWWNGWLSADAVDTTNSPTWRLRPGLVLGQISATKLWTNYSATATDGSQVAGGILVDGLRMQDVLLGTNTQKYYRIFIGGKVKAAQLIGLDNLARAQMNPRFIFDDDITGREDFPFLRWQTKTTSYTVVAADNMTEFNTLGAGAAVTFTLPAIANGYMFRFRNLADQNMIVASAEGTNMVALNNLSATSVAFQTGSGLIGGGFMIYSNPAGNKWIVQNISAGSNTITVA